jgi:acyl-coenzyme A thioesterase PaaI-like protein
MNQLVFKLRQKFLDRLINYYGPYVGAGVKLVHMSKDFREARVEMPLTVYNKNYMGTQFGGSLYSMTDPWYMLMLIKNLGPDYIVWDKSAAINFKKPGRSKVRAEFHLTQEVIDQIKEEVEKSTKVNWPFKVLIHDEENNLIAEVDKVLYVRKKSDKLKGHQTGAH